MVFKRWQIISGIALLVACTTASALSLGRVRGTALLGRSLDLSIQSTLDAQEPAPDASCLAAEVFYGDTRVAPSAVSLVPERVSSGELRIRIRASTVVDEPIVTLFVRSSCQGAQMSRRYVLLAEVLTEGEQSGSVAALPSLTQPAPLSSPRIAFGGAQPPVSSGASTPSGDTASSNAQARRAERAERRRAQRAAQAAAGVDVRPAPQAAQRVSRQVSVVRKTAVQETPRLKIDLLDLTASEPSLRGSAELSSAPSSDEAVRRQAQALWRALNASQRMPCAMRSACRRWRSKCAVRLSRASAKCRTLQRSIVNCKRLKRRVISIRSRCCWVYSRWPLWLLAL